jgi:hypothetical protein
MLTLSIDNNDEDHNVRSKETEKAYNQRAYCLAQLDSVLVDAIKERYQQWRSRGDDVDPKINPATSASATYANMKTWTEEERNAAIALDNAFASMDGVTVPVTSPTAVGVTATIVDEEAVAADASEKEVNMARYRSHETCESSR